MSTAQTAPSRKTRAKVEGTYISEGTHPHVFAAYPALRERASEGGGMVLMNDATLKAFEQHSASKVLAGPGPTSATRTATGANGWDPEITKTFSPAALDRMRGGPPKTEMSESAFEALRADLRAARAARRRH